MLIPPPIRVAALTAVLILLTSGLTRAGDLVFERDVLPVLKARCVKCHGVKSRKAGLNVSTFGSLKRGGESGATIEPGNADDSLLWQMIESGEMPPEGETPLKPDEKDLIRRWITGGAASQQADADRLTQHDVLPYIYTRCVVCHGRRRQEGGLDLRSVASMLKGGRSGPAVVPGKPVESLILKKIRAKDMPPPRELIRAGVRPFESSEIELLERWIAQGAKVFDVRPDVQTDKPDVLVTDDDRKFWSFQTPKKPPVPVLDDADAAKHRTTIDAFLLRRLREKKLDFSKQAERLTLIRRVAFDLTGLPPEWNDVERFLNDKSDQWYAKLVDHYLASEHYGERWGRYWLDLCGYADSEGKRSADPVRPEAWRYRDYVIRSLNADKPYDRFLLEQIAGDELYDFENADAITREMADAVIATGFLRMAPDGTGSDIVDTVDERFEVVADEIEILGTSVLGLTLKCAQCHSHKYDPIPQRDYYRLVAVFRGAYDVYDWLKPTSVPGQSQGERTRRYLDFISDETRQAYEGRRSGVAPQIEAARAMYEAAEAPFRKQFLDEQFKTIPEPIRDDVRSALETEAARRSPVQKYLVAKFEKQLTITSNQLQNKHKQLAKAAKTRDTKIADLEKKIGPQPMIRALWDRGEPSPTWIFRRGEFTNPGDLVGPGVLSVLTDGRTRFNAEPPYPGSKSTGRRLAFGRWLTDPKHPLTARVLVNRVWFHHFGRGIVESLANFGTTGTPPTHPRLLDWLAVSFVENGWSLKWLHREIMITQAYRQSSMLRPEHHERDPDNRWLSRMPMRRLEAEAVRDSLLAVAGRLNRSAFGRPDAVAVRDDGLVVSKPGEAGWRRTVYVQQRRKEIPTILENFDLPQMIPNCTERPNSTVASQALHLLNNGMVRKLAASFARRIATEIPNDRYRQVERVYQVALSRPPTAEERELALETLESLTAHWERVLQDQSQQPQASDVQSGDGEKKAPQPKPNATVPAETRALANFCHVILNSATFLFVD